jgi:signal peptidase II
MKLFSLHKILPADELLSANGVAMRNLIRNKWTLMVSVSLIGFLLDTLTKNMAAAHLPPGHQVNILGQYLSFVLVFNKAAIFGLDPRHLIAWFPLNGFFSIFSVLAMILLIVYYASLKNTDWVLFWGLSLIMPGAMGNFFDRTVYASRGVVDFIRLGISADISWFIFNFADMYITFGVALILLSMILEGRKKEAVAPSGSSPQVP